VASKVATDFRVAVLKPPLTDTHITVRPRIRPFADSAVDVIVTLLSDIRGSLYKSLQFNIPRFLLFEIPFFPERILRHYCTECPNFADGLEDIQI
jgi:hypothetical protein